MQKLRPLRPFNYSSDRFIIADMDGREKSYIVVLENHINDLTKLVNDLVDAERTTRIGKEEAGRLKEQKHANASVKKENSNVDTHSGTTD
jgi:hypothetical protein